jgi:hypothetical protein
MKDNVDVSSSHDQPNEMQSAGDASALAQKSQATDVESMASNPSTKKV